MHDLRKLVNSLGLVDLLLLKGGRLRWGLPLTVLQMLHVLWRLLQRARRRDLLLLLVVTAPLLSWAQLLLRLLRIEILLCEILLLQLGVARMWAARWIECLVLLRMLVCLYWLLIGLVLRRLWLKAAVLFRAIVLNPALLRVIARLGIDPSEWGPIMFLRVGRMLFVASVLRRYKGRVLSVLLEEWIQVGLVFFFRGREIRARPLTLPVLSLKPLRVALWALIFVRGWRIVPPGRGASSESAAVLRVGARGVVVLRGVAEPETAANRLLRLVHVGHCGGCRRRLLVRVSLFGRALGV
jgi:hypothetical protein